jgi:hypothetical protein
MRKIGLFIALIVVIAALGCNRRWSGNRPGAGGAPSGDIRVNTPHGKRYMGVPYFGTERRGGKTYSTITTYHYRK